jgi:hypothetical protein
MVQVGGLPTGERYVDFLTDVLVAREEMSPFSHIRKFDIRTGYTPEQLAAYLDERPQTIVAFADSTWTSTSRPSGAWNYCGRMSPRAA